MAARKGALRLGAGGVGGRSRPGWEPIDALIAVVREVDDPVGNSDRATAVFVDARARAKRYRQQILDVAASGTTHDGVASAFRRAQLAPVNVIAIDPDTAEADCFGNDKIGR